MSEKEITKVAKKYGVDEDYLKDMVYDMEGDGIEVNATTLADMIINGDL